ncbi:MAG: hypothetical protein ACK5MK_09745 [Dysgonomonas sp.]
MKRLTALLFFLTSAFILFGQSENKLQGLHGLTYKGSDYFEFAGNEISITTHKNKKLNAKDISWIKNKYNLKNVSLEYSDSSQSKPNRIIVSSNFQTDGHAININQTCYIFLTKNNEVETILFQTANARDTLAERQFLEAYNLNTIGNYATPCCNADSIDFAGRNIRLGSDCRWMSPHNVYCGNKGQVSWSEFSTFDEAVEDCKTRIKANEDDKSIVLSDEDLDIDFEGVPSVARRIVYLPVEAVYDKKYSNYVLVVYYVVEQVRGRYLSCVMSNYGQNRYDYHLGQLLAEVMTLNSVPDDAINNFDTNAIEELSNEEINAWKGKNTSRDYPFSFSVQAGALFPLGNLNSAFGTSPYVAAKFGVSDIKTGFRFDFGFGIGFPCNSSEFEYYDNGYSFPTKTSSILNISLWCGHEQKMMKNVYMEKYIGIGLGAMQTDTKKEVSDDEYDQWYSAETINLNLGVGIRYKKIGCFIEYNYAPYSIAGKVRSSYGNSYLTTGISFKF